MLIDYPIVDGHGHVIPYPNEIPDHLKDFFDVVAHKEKFLMKQPFLNNWTRPVAHPSFFVKERLEWMEKHSIVHTIMLTMSQFYCNRVPSKQMALDAMQFQNDFQYKIQSEHPTKFSCGSVILPRYIDESLREIEKRYAQGLKFICLPTHYKREDGKYISCTDTSCMELFSFANDLKIPIQFHPYDYEEIFNVADIDENWSGHKSPMPALTAQLYDRFTTLSLPDKFPNIRWYFAHGNIVNYATTGRQHQAFKARPDLHASGAKSPLKWLANENIFCDSIVHDPDLIWLLSKKIDPKRIIHGMDSPYPLGDGIDYLKDGMFPGCTIEQAEDFGYITPEQAKYILQKSGFDWLYGRGSKEAEAIKNQLF